MRPPARHWNARAISVRTPTWPRSGLPPPPTTPSWPEMSQESELW
jgi:hypothetical protein